MIYNKRKNNPINNNKVSWKIIEIAEHCYTIQNLFNLQFLQIINNSLRFTNVSNINIYNNCNYSTKYNTLFYEAICYIELSIKMLIFSFFENKSPKTTIF